MGQLYTTRGGTSVEISQKIRHYCDKRIDIICRGLRSCKERSETGRSERGIIGTDYVIFPANFGEDDG